MCTENSKPVQTDGQTMSAITCRCTDTDREYQRSTKLEAEDKSSEESSLRLKEKLTFVVSVLVVMFLSNAAVSFQWILPWFYGCATPVVILVKTICYWRYKWQFFMIDFCYTANTLVLIYLSIPGNENLFRVVFALANGPLLMAAVIYKNSLVFHHFDKVTSVYIHTLPALVTMCARWAPNQIGRAWFVPFIQTAPEFDVVWLYAVPFACFFLHSFCYFLIVNVIVRPKEPYLTSYKYLAVKYEEFKVLKGPVGQAIVYYGLNWLFCLCSLGLALLAYWSFLAHCVILAVVLTAVVYNGASYYLDVFSRRGLRSKG